MRIVVTFLVLALISHFVKQYGYENYVNYKKQPFLPFVYDFALSEHRYRDKCKLQGLIDEYENPSLKTCFCNYYIPNNINRAEYESEVQPGF